LARRPERQEGEYGERLGVRKRLKIQHELAFEDAGRGEAPRSSEGRVESTTAGLGTESQANTDKLIEEVCEKENLKEALRRVKANAGAAGIDGMTVRDLPEHLRKNWSRMKEQLLSGTYRPQPVRRVEIPKPGGGMRKLGIPTVADRFVQQAVNQVLQKRWDHTFSPYSYGFRPGRSAHQAVAKAQEYIQEGYIWVVDIDLEKFFDRVNHDVLMGRIAKRISDKCQCPHSGLRNKGKLPNCCSWGFPEEGREIGHGFLYRGGPHPTPTSTQYLYSTVLRKTITPPNCGAGG
jgi:hypothetical protein